MAATSLFQAGSVFADAGVAAAIRNFGTGVIIAPSIGGVAIRELR
ncbi:MAG: hypothetical protein ACKO1M_06995 [Planctomycetota bacterium]